MSSSDPFSPPTAKLTIGSLDEPGIQVEAQYNPKELSVVQDVPWAKPGAANQTGTQQGSGGGSGDPIALEFTGAAGRTMTVELLFDQYEELGGGRAVNVAKQVGILETLARIRNPAETDENKRRPHQCVVAWGGRGLPSFKCVITKLNTKYTMFSSDGEPLRATCTVDLKEAHAVDKKAGAK